MLRTAFADLRTNTMHKSWTTLRDCPQLAHRFDTQAKSLTTATAHSPNNRIEESVLIIVNHGKNQKEDRRQKGCYLI